jgi:CBS domain-containing protein
MKPVGELLKHHPPALRQIGPEASVYEALRVLAEHEVGALAVMDQGRLVGIVSERDYTRKVALQGRNSRETLVAEIMTREVLAVPPNTRTKTCMALMSQRKIRHLPVVEQGRVLGMISIRDILDDIIADHESTIAQLETYIHS